MVLAVCLEAWGQGVVCEGCCWADVFVKAYSDIYEVVSLFVPAMHMQTITHTNLFNYPYEDTTLKMVLMHFNFNRFMCSSIPNIPNFLL